VYVLCKENDTNQEFISYVPKFHTNYKIKQHYDIDGNPIEWNEDVIYIKPDVLAVTNKFNDIYDLVNNILNNNEAFYKAYEKFLLTYLNADIEHRMGVWFDHAPKLINYIDEIYVNMEIGKGMFVTENASYKLNINAKEADIIMKTSVRSRFFIPCYLGGNAVSEHQQKVIHTILNEEMIEDKILTKLFNIVSSMVIASGTKYQGRKIWEFLSRSKGYTQENHVMELLSSIYYKALPSLKPQDNPIAYMILVARNELNWLMSTSMTNLFLPSNIDTLSMIKPKGDIIQSEIFYRVIVQKLFQPIAESYKDYKELYHYNVYTTLYNLTQPLILQIFNLPIRSLNIANVHVLNFFMHKFLVSLAEQKRVNMEIMLITAPMINLDLKNLERLPINLQNKITTTLRPYFITKKITHLTLNTIKKYYTNTVLALYKNKYFNVLTQEYEKIDWNKFIEELISFTVNLAIHTYQKEIEEIKEKLYMLD